MGHLDEKSKENLSKVSKEFFRHDPREVVIYLPLYKSKEPSDFVCDHLKKRKKLLINIKKDFDLASLSEYDSLEMKYLKCLQFIEYLNIGGEKDGAILLADSNFSIQKMFPKLRHLQIQLNDQISVNENDGHLSIMETSLREKSFKMHQLENMTLLIKDLTQNLEYPLSPLILELKNFHKFKRLSIKYEGYIYPFRDILSQIISAKYSLDLETIIYGTFNMSDYISLLPKTTETLNLKYYNIEDVEKGCSYLLTLNYLKKLTLIPHDFGSLNCLLEYLPSSLTELTFYGSLENSNADKLSLPITLHTAHLGYIKSQVLGALANHVDVLEAKISDLQNILTIENPFTRVKTLIVKSYTVYSKAWLHLLDLIPINMNKVKIQAYLKFVEDINALENKIFTLRKRIKYFTISGYIISTNENYVREYVFEGSEMIRKK